MLTQTITLVIYVYMCLDMTMTKKRAMVDEKMEELINQRKKKKS